MKHTDLDNLPPRNIDELVYHMATVARQASAEWARGFALSVITQSRRRNWKPSAKQEAMMRKLVSELFTAVRGDDDLQVIE